MNFTLVNKTTCIVAKRNSGKSELIKFIVLQQKRFFSKIYVISPTESINHHYENSGLVESKNIMSEWSERWVMALIDKMTKLKSQGSKATILLILDDICSDTRLHDSSAFKVLFTRGRHLGISVCITQQSINHVPPAARNNADFILLGQLSRASIELAQQEYQAGPIDKRQFMQIYHDNTKDYSFLLINNNSVKDSSDLNQIYGSLKVPSENI